MTQLPEINDSPPFLTEHHQRVIILGNGPSAVKGKFGAEIDKFDLVVRINNYHVSGYESRIGSRTDIWANGANQGLDKRKDLPAHILVLIPPVVLRGKGDAIHTRIRKRLGTNAYHLVPLEDMQRLEHFSGIERPTTGLFTILYFLAQDRDLTLHGFDFFVGSKSHYFDSRFKRRIKESGLLPKAGKHDTPAEKAWVEHKISEGEIRRLT